MKTSNKITALYCRSARKDRAAIQSQKSTLKSFANDREFKNASLFIDNGYNGSNLNRKAWRKLESKIRNGLIDNLIVCNISRLGRDYCTVLDLTQNFLLDHGVNLVLIDKVDMRALL